jgi:SAM-dependent methyltransferase
MCNEACLEFGRAFLREAEIRGKSVIEVGSMDVNGSLRPAVEAYGPERYIGVDFQMGPGVDLVCDACDLLDRFERGSFDLLISTELLEHVRDWRKVIGNFKNLLKTNGTILITTRSKGCGFHGYPFDFWRYETADLEAIFSDFDIEVVEKDPSLPGVFLKAAKPDPFTEKNLDDLELYSILKDKRVRAVSDGDVSWFKAKYTIRRLPWKAIKPVKVFLEKKFG